jgi:hypothetical protein
VHYDSSYLIPADVPVFPCQRRMRRIPVRAQEYEARSYTVCGSIPASICILVDSLAWSRPYVFWIPMLLSYFEERTGMKAVAICMGGARVLRGDYTWMYESVFGESSCEYILVLAFGNDVYKLPTQPPSYYDEFPERMRSLAIFGRVGLVFGGSSSIWKYTKPGLYDVHVRRVCDACEGIVSFVSTGADMLHGIQIADSIGHVRTSSVPVLVQAFFVWMRELMKIRSRL